MFVCGWMRTDIRPSLRFPQLNVMFSYSHFNGLGSLSCCWISYDMVGMNSIGLSWSGQIAIKESPDISEFQFVSTVW